MATSEQSHQEYHQHNDYEEGMGTMKGRSPGSTTQPTKPKSSSIPVIMYTTTSYYQPFCMTVLSIPLMIVAIQFLLAFNTMDEYDRKAKAWTLVWVFILVIVLYMMILPRKIDIRSNGILSIKSFLLTYQFKGIRGAHMAGVDPGTVPKPRMKFATSFNPLHRVVIQRKDKKWDLVVSPDNVHAFLTAMEQVVTNIEKEEAEAWTLVPKNHSDNLPSASMAMI